MAFVIGSLLALIFLDGWAAVAVIAAVAALEVFEIGIWLRWRKVKSSTGAEGIIGMKGKALSDLSPAGQVWVKGQIWKARSPDDISEGDEVVVQSVQGLELTVSRR